MLTVYSDYEEKKAVQEVFARDCWCDFAIDSIPDDTCLRFCCGIMHNPVCLKFNHSSVICVYSVRKFAGGFNVLSVSFTPAFLSSLVAIHLERASRRPILCLYVTNVVSIVEII